MSLHISDYGLPIVEPFAIPADFVHGVAPIERVSGGCVLLRYYVREREELVVIRKIVFPLEARPAIRAAFALFDRNGALLH